MNQLRRDTQITFLSRIPVMLLSFLSVVFITRLLGPEGNGVYTYVYAALNLLITIFGFQLNSSLTFFLASKQFENQKIFSAIGFLSLTSIILLCIHLWIIVFIIPGGQALFIPPDQPILFFFCFLLIAFFLRYFTDLFQSVLRGLFRFKSFNIYLLLMQLVPVWVYGALLLVTLIRKNQFELLTSFKIILLTESTLLMIGLGILLSTKEIKLDRDFTFYQKDILRYSSGNFLSMLGHFLNKRLDVWFVQHLRGIIALGQYGLATQIANFINEAMIPFNQVLLPYLAGSPSEAHKLMVGRIARLNLYLALIAAIIVATTSWLFIPVLFGKQFNNAIPATQILSIGIIFISQRLVYSNYFMGINRINIPIRASWVGVVITIVLDLLLIPPYGIIGASIATVVSYGITSCFLVFHAYRMMDLHLYDLFRLQKSDLQWLLTKSPGKQAE